MEYYLAIKRNEIGSFIETRMHLETVRQSEPSESGREKQISYINAYMWNQENGIDDLISKEETATQM